MQVRYNLLDHRKRFVILLTPTLDTFLNFRDREQKQREEALRDFRKGEIKVLVATDVCARGIDVKDLEHVS